MKAAGRGSTRRGLLGASLGAIALAASLAAILLATPAHAQDPQAGKLVFDKWCAPCHGDGPGKPGTDVLRQRYGDSLPALLEQRDDMTAEYLRGFVREGIGVMPQFRKTEITDAELDAMIEYLLR